MDTLDDDAGPNFVLDIWMDFHTEVFDQRVSHGVSLDRGDRGPRGARRGAEEIQDFGRVVGGHWELE